MVSLLQVTVAPHETLFEVGENSNAGIFIVLEGQLGVFLPEGDQLRHSNTLQTGESVGDLDVLDGALLFLKSNYFGLTKESPPKNVCISTVQLIVIQREAL